VLDTSLGREKKKPSAVFRQTIVFTSVTMAIVFAMVIIIRIFYVQFTIRTYSDLYAAELNIATGKKEKLMNLKIL
jgi:hypothetical protein